MTRLVIQLRLILIKKKIKISRATTYRTLDVLVKHEYIRKMDIGDGKWRYEHWLNCHQHDHLICIRCGTIVEFINTQIEGIQKDVADKFNYQLVRHVHQLFGLCKQCQDTPVSVK